MGKRVLYLELESKVKLGEFYKELRLARKVKQKDVAKMVVLGDF